MPKPNLETITIELKNKVARVELNRPERANALNQQLWDEIKRAFQWIDEEPSVRVAVLSGSGKHFCSGIDLELFASLGSAGADDPARKADQLRQFILGLQANFSAIEKCRKPVLAAIHGACLGGGIDMISAVDMRYSTVDARFSILEIELGMAADVGTLQRLPRLVGDGVLRELAYTGRYFDGEEAVGMNLVNRTYPDKDVMLCEVIALAELIASKAPGAIRSIKQNILYARDHSVEDSLDYISLWNAGQLQGKEVLEALRAKMMKQPPVFEDS